MITLTDEEQRRFIQWLEEHALSSGHLAKQAETLGPAFWVVVQKERAEAAAMLLVARRLRNTESQSIG